MSDDVEIERARLSEEFRRKSHRRLPGREPAQVAIHFGVRVQSGAKQGLRIDRDKYAQINKRSSSYWRRDQAPELWDSLDEYYEDDEHRVLTDSWCIEQQERALRNFDLNMAYFDSLDRHEFRRSVDTAVASHRGMVEVTDLNRWDGKTGLYVMVLDDYCQAYVGVTESAGGIKARIRQHWSTTKAFDRLLWGGVEESILAIDSFRALDTTRIFAASVKDPHGLENKVMESFPNQFLANRIPGGRGDLISFAARLGADIVKTRELPEQP